jgi:hypothetical protein
MANRNGPNGRLRALLVEARWTHAELARAVNAIGGEIGLPLSYDRTSIAHWLSGTRPRPPVPQLLAEAFSRRLGRSVTAAAAGFPEDGEGLARTTGSRDGSDAVSLLAELSATDADPVLRVPLRRSPYSTVPGTTPRWREPDRRPEQPVDEVSRPAGPQAGPAELATLRTQTRSFAAGLDRHGGGHARTALSVYLADDVVPWLRRPADNRTHRQLLSESARLTFVLARLHSDSSLHGVAQRYYNTALRLANEADDLVAWAVTLRGASSQALALDHRRTALAHGENAYAALPPHTPAAVRSFVAAQLAVARAASGNRHEALAALTTAERAATTTELGAGPFETYPRAALEYQRAQTLRLLGDFTAAAAALAASSRHRLPDDRRGHTLTYALHARLLLRTGHLEEACACWRTFLAVGAGLQSGSVDHARRVLRHDFRRYRSHPAVRELLAGQRDGSERST